LTYSRRYEDLFNFPRYKFDDLCEKYYMKGFNLVIFNVNQCVFFKAEHESKRNIRDDRMTVYSTNIERHKKGTTLYFYRDLIYLFGNVGKYKNNRKIKSISLSIQQCNFEPFEAFHIY